MTEPPAAPSQPADEAPPAAEQQDADGAREPDDSPQRRLVESVAAYEVDPPAPARVREEEPGA